MAWGEKLLLNQNSERRIRSPPSLFLERRPLRSCGNSGRPVTVTFVHDQFAFFAGAHSRAHRCVLSIFTSWLWMGSIFHRFQKLTPQTWRLESGRSHALSSAMHILAALGIALLFTMVAGDQSSPFAAGVGGSVQFGLMCWGVFALPIVLGSAIYINLHLLVVVGQLLDWLSVSLLATVITAWWPSR